MKPSTPATVILTLALACAAAPGTAVAAPLLFDFGPGGEGNTTPQTAQWGRYNNLTNATTGSIANLANAHGASTGIGILVTNPFNGLGSGSIGGEVSSEAGFHENAQKDSFYRNAAGVGTVQLRGLPSSLLYEVVLFSSRLDTFADTRISQFTVGGEVIDVDSRGNTSNVARFSSVLPQYNALLDSYVIDVDMQRKDGSSHAYMNAMKLTPAGINYDTPWSLYSQDFDSLASGHGTSAAWADGITIPGWYAATSASDTFTTYTPWDGRTFNQNALLSLGTDGDEDRALGFQTLSGSVDAHYGLRLVNTTDMTLNEFTLSYRGEQWRHVSGNNVDSLLFDFQVFDSGDGSLTTATGWTAVDSLRFDSPNNSGLSRGLDGNLPENSEFLTATTRGFSWEPGQELWLRWTDTAASWQMMGIDDVSFRAIPEPGSLLLLLAGALATLVRRRRGASRHREG